MRGLVASCLLAVSLRGLAGNQIYEPLADSVRQRLSAMVSERAPASLSFRSAQDGQRWIDEMDKRLAAGSAEYKGRRDEKPRDMPLKEVVAFLKSA